MIFALFLAAQIATADDPAFENVKLAKLAWGTCMDVYGMTAAMVDKSITASDAAGAA